ncbi:MAG TPA: histidine kinase [Myxococcaceae bacterium]|nr:histidine kinase [Myxococcaceae bacterium]
MRGIRTRFATAVFQLDVALVLACAAVSAASVYLFYSVPAAELARIPLKAVLDLVPLLVLVRFARGRSDAGRPLPLGALALGTAIASTLGAVVTTYPDRYEVGAVALGGFFGLVRAALFVGAVELHARAVRSQALAHELRQITARLEAELQEARARVLEAQIEPHFLFNTLANVRQLQRADPSAGLEMLDDLIQYLERSLPGLQRERTTLEAERALVSAYLRLHRPRFGPRLQYDITFPDPLLGCELPSMMLLTLVENSLKHGVGPLPQGGAIRLSAESSGDVLLVDVVDTGAGMGAGTGGGTGLANIRSRLALRYGDAARLTLTLNTPRGVRASLSIPLAGAASP